jgi:Cu/Ag efflux pump CusA
LGLIILGHRIRLPGCIDPGIQNIQKHSDRTFGNSFGDRGRPGDAFLTGETLSFTATIGFIALVGIEVKNSLLVVDFTNQLREQGKGIEEAIIEAGEIRFVPILLTSMTAIGGLLPLVFEYSALYSPLALVLIGGLISSTLLSRLVTPVMYKLLPPTIVQEVKEEAVAELQY